MISLVHRALSASSSLSPAEPRRALLTALLSRPARPSGPCRAPAPPEPPRRAFHASPSPVQGHPGVVGQPEPGVAVGDGGLEISRLWISGRIVEGLAARGITRLFPIQALLMSTQ